MSTLQLLVVQPIRIIGLMKNCLVPEKAAEVVAVPTELEGREIYGGAPREQRVGLPRHLTRHLLFDVGSEAAKRAASLS